MLEIDSGARKIASSNNGIETRRRGINVSSLAIVDTASRLHRVYSDPPPEDGATESPWPLARRRNWGDLRVSIGGGNEAFLCVTHTIILSQTESSTATCTIQIEDPLAEFLPTGSGIHSESIKAGKRLSILVQWGGHHETFVFDMKEPAIVRSGGSHPAITWQGVDVTAVASDAKANMATAGQQPNGEAVTNKQLLHEIWSSVGVNNNWQGIPDMRVQGPFHRQQMTPADLGGKVQDLTWSEYRTEELTLVGYDPFLGGNTWTYDPDQDEVSLHQISPTTDTLYDQVIVLRAIDAGELVPLGAETEEMEVLEFGEYTVNLPSLSGCYHRVEYASHLGAFSDFRYATPDGLVIRAPRAYWPPGSVKSGPIWNATSVTFTWGAANPGVTRRGITKAPGAIKIYGRHSPQGTTGTGPNAQGPLDKTTKLVLGNLEPDAKPLELAPNPLLYGEAEMRAHGNGMLKRILSRQREHRLRLPLNPKIRCGDKIRLRKDRLLGGGGDSFHLIVTSWTHSLSVLNANRYTDLTCVEYVL